MIRVLHMIGSLNIGGSQALVMNLYRSINRQEIQFDFIIDRPNELYYADEIKEMGGNIYVLPAFTGVNFAQIRKAWASFLANHPEYKILHCHVRSYASVFLPIVRKAGLKTIIHSHSTSNGSGIKGYVKYFFQLPLRYCADYYLGCSKKSGEWLFGKKIVNGPRFAVLANGVDLEKFRFDDFERASSRGDMGVTENTKIYLHVGRFHESKNHEFLLQVFADIVKTDNNSRLWLVGDGELRDVIENAIQSLKLNNYVCLLGARSDVSSLMQAADCFLFPSKWEGLPVTVVEAQAAGLPCLISDTITKEVDVSNLVTRLSIQNGTRKWAEKAVQTDREHLDVSEQIKAAGYDIQSSVAWLTEFYRRIINE